MYPEPDSAYTFHKMDLVILNSLNAPNFTSQLGVKLQDWD